ncbi:MAG TPA: hypothetical protein PKC91_15205 [Ignavibacteria bacterium]|nr:hypothetical protein [Ignavibacteria bacterium]
MKKYNLLCLLIIFTLNNSYSQTANSPYPVIFVHGLNSDDQTWSNIITQLSSVWNLSSSHTLNAVLNARGGDTTNFIQDVLIPVKDLNGNFVNNLTSSSIYSVNYNNFWNRNPSDPRIILYNASTPGTNQSSSNQSAITKQGYALKILIDSVLRITGASKVILLGHSMGGLAIREYLQRKENGIHKWWIDPLDSTGGHKVAKVITIGTPHQGTNVTSIPLFTIDNNSEAMRDMRISYPDGSGGAYLFGNIESLVPSSYYNKDINCNGIINDTIAGMDSVSADNSKFPLPKNIQYTWITSNYLGLGTDLAVTFSSQSLYRNSQFVPAGMTDTLRTNKNHIQETTDNRSLIRGLDEPDRKEFAYDITSNKLYAGSITLQSNAVTSDSDFYKVQLNSPGKIRVNLSSLNCGVTNLALLSETGSILFSNNISAATDSVTGNVSSGNYLVRITGNSNLNPNLNFYRYTADFIPSPELNITAGIEGMRYDSLQVQDTVRIYLMNPAPPFNRLDSSKAFLNSNGNAHVFFANAVSGSYYLRLLHRNALETWSSAPVAFSPGVPAEYDFTASQSSAFGNNQILRFGKWCMFSGDINGNGNIDLSDIIGIYNDASGFINGYNPTDLTGDSITDLTDIVIAYNNSVNFVSAIKP